MAQALNKNATATNDKNHIPFLVFMLCSFRLRVKTRCLIRRPLKLFSKPPRSTRFEAVPNPALQTCLPSHLWIAPLGGPPLNPKVLKTVPSGCFDKH
jgi:hypothetical protein